MRKSRINLVQRALGVEFELLGDVKLQDYSETLKEAGHSPFDVVVFSGVLYHMFDPLGGLAAVRGMVRDGGILLVETTAIFEDSDAMHLNAGGRAHARADSGSWHPSCSVTCFDSFASSLWTSSTWEAGLRRPKVHHAAASRLPAAQSLSRSLARAMIGSARHIRKDFEEFLDWDSVKSDAAPVGYDSSRDGLVSREAGGLDVGASVAAMRPLKVERDQTRLRLDAKY